MKWKFSLFLTLCLTPLVFAQTDTTLDANAVGGMYSGKIQIIQNPKGMGVNSHQLPKSEQARLNASGEIEYEVPVKAIDSQSRVEIPNGAAPIESSSVSEVPRQHSGKKRILVVSQRKKLPPLKSDSPKEITTKASMPPQDLAIIEDKKREEPKSRWTVFVEKLVEKRDTFLTILRQIFQ